MSDVILRERREFLSRTEFDFLRMAHFDFVVASRVTEPIFAVEFDGPHHDDPEQVSRDIMKNRLCKKAGLPLLRIGASDTEEHDRVSLLDFMLERYIAWQREHRAIQGEINEYADSLPPEDFERVLDDDCDPWLDSSFVFDLRHRFPARNLVLDRLRYEHAIELWNGQRTAECMRFFVDVNLGISGESSVNDEFHRAQMSAVVRPADDPLEKPVFHGTREAHVRSWLRCIPDSECATLADLVSQRFDAVELLEHRVQMMWFPELPGMWPWDHIAKHFADYLVLRSVEDWASGGPQATDWRQLS